MSIDIQVPIWQEVHIAMHCIPTYLHCVCQVNKRKSFKRQFKEQQLQHKTISYQGVIRRYRKVNSRVLMTRFRVLRSLLAHQSYWSKSEDYIVVLVCSIPVGGDNQQDRPNSKTNLVFDHRCKCYKNISTIRKH